jgi:L-amino acid N-acyltransferase YncA
MNTRITFNNLEERTSFRFASLLDLDELMELYERFYAEAVYKDFLEWSPAKARRTVENGIASDTRPHVIAEVDGKLVGFISYIFDDSFSVRPCQVLFELYVVPEHRRSAIGRSLVGIAILEGETHNAGAFHAPVASGMTEARTLFNLFSKAGFRQFGYMMRRGF